MSLLKRLHWVFFIGLRLSAPKGTGSLSPHHKHRPAAERRGYRSPPARGSPPLRARALAQQLERRVPVPGLEPVRVAGVPALGLPQLQPGRRRFAN